MCTKNNKLKNSTQPEQNEAVGLMGWLGAISYKFSISSSTSFFEVVAENYDDAIDKIKHELKVPNGFMNDLFLENITVVDNSNYSQE